MKKGNWFVGDRLIVTSGLELDVPGLKDGYGGGYREGVVAVLSALFGKVAKPLLNTAFDKAVSRFSANVTEWNDGIQLSYRDILFAQNNVGHISILVEMARTLGYPYVLWNERIYSVGQNDCKDTGLTQDSIVGFKSNNRVNHVAYQLVRLDGESVGRLIKAP